MGPQILWVGLEMLGPEDDVKEKERREERKIKFLLLFFVSLHSMWLSHLSRRSRYPVLVT